jgi:hypothetical protein
MQKLEMGGATIGSCNNGGLVSTISSILEAPQFFSFGTVSTYYKPSTFC